MVINSRVITSSILEALGRHTPMHRKDILVECARYRSAAAVGSAVFEFVQAGLVVEQVVGGQAPAAAAAAAALDELGSSRLSAQNTIDSSSVVKTKIKYSICQVL